MDCICNKPDFQVLSQCKICHNNFNYNPQERSFHCPVHKQIACCGLAEGNCCQSCKNKGYQIISGYGGPDIFKLNGVEITLYFI